MEEIRAKAIVAYDSIAGMVGSFDRALRIRHCFPRASGPAKSGGKPLANQRWLDPATAKLGAEHTPNIFTTLFCQSSFMHGDSSLCAFIKLITSAGCSALHCTLTNALQNSSSLFSLI